MFGHRKQVEPPQRTQPPACIEQDAEVARERGGITSDINDPAGTGSKTRKCSHDQAARPLTRGIEHHEVDIAERLVHESRCDGSLTNAHLGLIGRVPRRVRTRPSVSLDRQHRSATSHDVAYQSSEQACPCVQIGHSITGARLETLQHGPTENPSGLGMYLPEDARADFIMTPKHREAQPFGLPGDAPVHDETSVERRQAPRPAATSVDRDDTLAALGGEHLEVFDIWPLVSLHPESLDSSRSDETAVDQLQLVGAMPVKSHAPGVIYPEPNACSPPKTAGGTGNFGHLDDTFYTGQTAKLLSHKIRLEAPLRLEAGMLPVTAAATTGACIGTRRDHTVEGRFDDLERVGPQVRPRFLADGRKHPLTGQAVTDKDDATVISPRDATAASRDLSRFQLYQCTVVHEASIF